MQKAFREGLNTVLVSGDAEAFSRRFGVEPSRKVTFRESLTVAESHFSRGFYAKPSRKLIYIPKFTIFLQVSEFRDFNYGAPVKKIIQIPKTKQIIILLITKI